MRRRRDSNQSYRNYSFNSHITNCNHTRHPTRAIFYLRRRSRAAPAGPSVLIGNKSPVSDTDPGSSVLVTTRGCLSTWQVFLLSPTRSPFIRAAPSALRTFFPPSQTPRERPRRPAEAPSPSGQSLTAAMGLSWKSLVSNT